MTPVVDERGRLFGRINLVDAAIGAFVIVLIPLAYGTVLLFRPSKPTITSVDHAQMTNVEERAGGGTRIDGKLKIHGTGLRPTLRATIGEQDAVGFLFETPSSADVLFGAIRPGIHDLVLYDGVQEVARSKDAVTISPPPVPVSSSGSTNRPRQVCAPAHHRARPTQALRFSRSGRPCLTIAAWASAVV